MEESRTKVSQILAELTRLANPANVAGMQRYGINPKGTLGISIPAIRTIARRIGKDHLLAQELWDSDIHEARILAALIAEPGRVTEDLMEKWVFDFDSWDVCDQVCSNLFDRSPLAVKKAVEWSSRQEEYVKRASFTLMASLAVHDKKLGEDQFIAFLDLIELNSQDDRNFVKKAVNWALRGIGKRSRELNRAAINTANKISLQEARSAHWIARDALRELQSEKVQQKLGIGFHEQI